MNARPSHRSIVTSMLVVALAAAPAAQAADRRFEPVPQSATQVVKVVADSSIISSAGKQFHAGASIAPESSRKAWLSVSVKNMTAAPLGFGEEAIVAVGNGKPLTLTRQAEPMAAEAAEAKPAAEQLGSGQLVVRQYQLDLPKHSKSVPLLIKVSVTLGGEAISFDFKEVD